MNKSLQVLCQAIKKIINEVKPHAQGFSFLILTGKNGQGKKTLLRQSQFQHIITDGDESTAIFYNQHGIIIELSESWLHQSKSLLQQTLKQLNRCHRALKITGILLCLDVKELSLSDPIESLHNIKAHTDLLHRFGVALEYHLDLGIILTKLDSLAGFCEFYQQEHASELEKPFGFSLKTYLNKGQLEKNFKTQFDSFCQSINQQVLNKVHPVRSDLKRTLIREFPLQIASLRLALQSLIEAISPKQFSIQSFFLTSAEQGGFSEDQLNKKIHHEYALTVQDKFPLSTNYRAYFIVGALTSFQLQTKQQGFETGSYTVKSIGALTAIGVISLSLLTYHHLESTLLLDKASKEWIAFDTMANQQNGEVPALYHLNSAATIMQQMHNYMFSQGELNDLKTQLNQNKSKHLHGIFLPSLLKEVEFILTDNQQPYAARYEALKTYLMLSEPEHYQAETVSAWFQNRWQADADKTLLAKKLALLQQAIKLPHQAVTINQQVLNDTRNYLNAIPANYLYYALAKSDFPLEKKSVDIKGFALPDTSIPCYFTKEGFRTTLSKLPAIAKQLSMENWVLDKQSPANLNELLQQAYAYDYTLYWKNFTQKSGPLRAQNYQEAIRLINTIRQANSLNKFATFIQEQTSPELNDSSALFNQQVAGQFTDLNLVSESAIVSLTQTLGEMEKFLTTISIVNDQGRTAFTFTKSRFQGDSLTNPLSAIFNQTEQLPEPIATWARQIANDTWFILINDTKHYINSQWQIMVYQNYIDTIAKRFPFDPAQTKEVSLANFNHFFATNGILNTFIEQNIKPFLDTSDAQWKPKELNHFVLPISTETLNEIMRANVITNMFFPKNSDSSQIEFSLQKSDLDPTVASLNLKIGETTINDNQENNSFTQFHWPETNAKLVIKSLEGEEYSLDEKGLWAFFKLLQQVNVQADNDDNSRLQVLFEINGSSGRYLLTTKNEINPFTPGILNGFNLNESIA